MQTLVIAGVPAVVGIVFAFFTVVSGRPRSPAMALVKMVEERRQLALHDNSAGERSPQPVHDVWTTDGKLMPRSVFDEIEKAVLVGLRQRWIDEVVIPSYNELTRLPNTLSEREINERCDLIRRINPPLQWKHCPSWVTSVYGWGVPTFSGGAPLWQLVSADRMFEDLESRVRASLEVPGPAGLPAWAI